MELLDNRTPQVEFNIIHIFILALLSTNKAELVKVDGHGDVYANYEAANSFYIVLFKYVPCTLQEYMESYVNPLASGDLVFNAIYTYPGRHKSHFYVGPYKTKHCDCVNEYSSYSKYWR